jgi:hypothetical protein
MYAFIREMTDAENRTFKTAMRQTFFSWVHNKGNASARFAFGATLSCDPPHLCRLRTPTIHRIMESIHRGCST